MNWTENHLIPTYIKTKTWWSFTVDSEEDSILPEEQTLLLNWEMYRNLTYWTKYKDKKTMDVNKFFS
jgi:hypothetical protein